MDVKAAAWLVTVGVSAMTAGVGVYAYFSDQINTPINLFQAGTLDLKFNGLDAATVLVTNPNMAPGDTAAGAAALTNAGTVTGPGVDLDLAIDVTSTNAGGAGATDIAKFLRIDTLTYGGVAIVVLDTNGNGFADLDDWDSSNLASRDLLDPGAAGKTIAIAVKLDTTAGNDLQGDKAEVVFKFFLAQAAAPDLQEPAPA